MDFLTKLENLQQKNNSLLCVGLDPQVEQIHKGFSFTYEGESLIFEFNKWIIDQTADLVCAYKPNIAFYEAYALEGLSQLKKTVLYLQNEYSRVPIILDAKRADIPNTAVMYAKNIFEYWAADATTVYPHLGMDSLEPFFAYKDKFTFPLIKTSNKDSNTFQNLKIGDTPYYLKMAQIISKWKFANLGLFVGATYPEELAQIRKIFPSTVILSAGIGAQGADIEKAVKAGIRSDKKGIIFNASRSIIYSADPAKSAKNLRNEINKYRSV